MGNGASNPTDGTSGSFNHSGYGDQSFSQAKIHSGADSNTNGRGNKGTVDSFTKKGVGNQNFNGADIYSGAHDTSKKEEEGQN